MNLALLSYNLHCLSCTRGDQNLLCCMQRELYPRLIQDVQLMINELGNLTVLWEELWLGTLQDLHAGNHSSPNTSFLFSFSLICLNIHFCVVLKF